MENLSSADGFKLVALHVTTEDGVVFCPCSSFFLKFFSLFFEVIFVKTSNKILVLAHLIQTSVDQD